MSTSRSLTLPDGQALATDLYQLTMMQAYRRERMTAPATFDLFVRRLPQRRNFLLAAGLDSALEYLESVRFTQEDLAFLDELGLFGDDFLQHLEGFRFRGDVRAVREGTVVFAGEPILEVTAPIDQAQLVETFLLNQITFQTVLASKAARVTMAADGRPVSDFGMRRMHGREAAMQGARAMAIGGVSSTSNVEAARHLGLPALGTMAHSYIEAHDSEIDALRHFSELYPATTLLVDTYDTLEGVRRVIDLQNQGARIGAVRLDSGDLEHLSKESRRILNEAGLESVRIVASGGLDEDSIDKLVRAGAPIDAFGVGTRMGTSADAPAVDSVYKLADYDGAGRMKLSEGKETLPGRKQVFREIDHDQMVRDVIGRADDSDLGDPLLRPVMEEGARLESSRDSFDSIREHAQRQLSMLPKHVRGLGPADPSYEVLVSERLAEHRDEVKRSLA